MQNNPRNSGRAFFSVILVVLLLSVIAGGGYYAFPMLSDSNPEERELDKYFKVKRGDFDIAIMLDGTLDARKNYDIRVEAKHNQRTITKMIDDKSEVKEGDIILEFSKEKHEENLDRLVMELDDVRKDLLLAEEDLKIKKAGNLGDIKGSSDNLRRKKEALNRYRDLDAVKSRKDRLLNIENAEKVIVQATSELSAAKDALMQAQGDDESQAANLSKTVTNKETALKNAETKSDTARHNYRVFRQYDFPQQLRRLKADVEAAELNQRKVIVRIKGSSIQSRRSIDAYNRRIARKEEQITKLKEDIGFLVVKAPADGIVTFGDRFRRHWKEPKELKVGVNCNFNEMIGTIPDMSSYEVKVDVPEEFRAEVKEGLAARFRSPSVRGLIMKGVISEIATMPRHIISWDKSSPNVYATKIQTDSSDDRLMSGMSLSVELIVDTVKNVKYVPVEAVYNREGKTYCKIRTAMGMKEMRVDVGRGSNDNVEILEGLREGDEVLLARAGMGK